jgi:hypothetical protein
MRLATIAAALVLFSAPLAVEAQQPEKVYRVGVLTNKASDPAEARLWQAFRSGLRERGWIEGKNILPGARFPVHTHKGPEFVFILEGELVQGGRRLGPGWASVAGAGTVDEDVHSERGCVFVVVDQPEPRNTGGTGRT